MAKGKVLKIDLSNRRFQKEAEQYFEQGDYLSSLRFAHRHLSSCGENKEIYALLADIYENLGLHCSAINHWFLYLDLCDEEDLPEAYEGLAVNYLNLGNEAQSAFYYNRLIDEDDSLTSENKREIAQMFTSDEQGFRFVYPPNLADYSKELYEGGSALKSGDLEGAISSLSKVEKGAKQYQSARETLAIAYLLSGDSKKAEQLCIEVTQEYGLSVQALATLSAIYAEQGRKKESKDIARKLFCSGGETAEEKYKIATVCCENDMHEEAFVLFCELEKDLPYDGNLLYFKAVAACNSNRIQSAISTLEKLCAIYPDAAVAAYYLKGLKRYAEDEEKGERPEMTYFYRLPQKEREVRCRALVALGKAQKEEAKALGDSFYKEGIFAWCFDEMDGMEKDLQYLGIVTAERARQDGFLKGVLLDCEVADALKIEILRLLYMRNEGASLGMVVCHIYKRVEILPIKLGRKKRKPFLEAYARLSSRFTLMNDNYAKKIKEKTQELYHILTAEENAEIEVNENDLAAALYFLSGIRELGNDIEKISSVFDGDEKRIKKLLYLAEKQTEDRSDFN